MMRATSPVRLSGPHRRQRILDAAVEAFAARGYDAASMSEIAAASGITKPIKQGLPGLAEGWADHPEVPGETLVEAAMDVVWIGLRGHLGPTEPRPGVT